MLLVNQNLITMRTTLLFLTLLCSTLIFSQEIPEEVKPPSWNLDLLTPKPFKLPSFDLKKLEDEDKINDQNKSIPWRFGKEMYVGQDFNEIGDWQTLPNGDRIWRMAYKSDGAYTLNFIFDQFWLPEGAKLYVYNTSKTDLLRPFTHFNNNVEEVLGTWLVQGDQAIIEYYQPANVTQPARITVGSVVHGYRTAESYQKALNDSGDCNHDVDCDITPASDPYLLDTRKEEVKKAVGMLVTGASGFCSGTLINNTAQDGTPYFITANHCGGGESTWAFRFNWRSPNPSCGTTTASTNGTYNQTVSGATLRAASSQSDMELVEINDTSFFNNNPDVIWAGWNRSTTQTPIVNFGIHHPSGDIQKVCREDDGAYRQTVSFNGNANTQMWYINQWELGVTEPGSSGSGLFNESGHLIGMLSGGAAACTGTSNNGQYDFYGRFDVAWDFGTTASTRLRDWLDPGNTGVETVEIYPPLQVFNIDANVSAGSGNSNLICNEDFSPSVTLINSGALNLTSATVVYYLDSEVQNVINWTGTLLTGESEVLATPVYSNLSSGSHSFHVSVTNPNATSDENTINDNFTYTFNVSPAFVTNQVIFNITTDNYGSETSWDLKNSSGIIVQSGPMVDYGNAQTYQETITIPTLDECYTFTIYDQYGDGICCDFGTGSYNLEDDSGNVIFSGGEFGDSESTLFKVASALSISEYNLNSLIDVYPNPVKHNLYVNLRNINSPVDYTIQNVLGKTMVKGSLTPSVLQPLSMSNLNAGIYFLRLNVGEMQAVFKIVKN